MHEDIGGKVQKERLKCAVGNERTRRYWTCQ